MTDIILGIAPFLQGFLQLDTDLFLAINGWHGSFGDSFMALYSGKYIWVPMYLSLIYVMLRKFPLKVNLVCLAITVALVAINDQVSANLLRHWVERMRPSNPENPLWKAGLVHIVNGYHGGRFGFPSAHSANCWGAAFFFIYVFRDRVLSCWLCLWAAVMCWSRMYLGVHYPGDILVGMLVGLTASSFVYWVFQHYLHGYTKLLKEKEVGWMRYVPVAVGLLTVLVIISLAAWDVSV